MKKDIIPIVFAANSNYVPYMATAMQSIMENADKGKEYIFYVLHREIDNANESLLKKQVSQFISFSIVLINVFEHIKKYSLFVSRHITIEAYFRLLIPYILSEYQKVLYLDCDIICCDDISKLFEFDLGDNLIGAVRDGVISRYYHKKYSGNIKFHRELLLELKNPEHYFNTGILLLNLDLFRKTTSADKLFELAISRKWQFHDQDLLNIFAEGKVLFLPYNWNFMHNRFKDYLPDYFLSEYLESEKNPKIIHYVGLKPWMNEVLCPHFEAFWKYSTRTPFLEIIIHRMKEKYFILDESFKQRIILKIKHKRDIGIRFILVDCIKAWLFRNKK